MTGVQNAIFLTYSLSLPWFERLILARLRANGLRRALVLADSEQLSQHIENDFVSLAGAGRSYVVQGVSAYSSFHPKAILLTGPKVARLYVGSGNLNRSGLSSNREVFETWTARPGDESIPDAFADFQKFLAGVIAKSGLYDGVVGEEIRTIVDSVESNLPVRRKKGTPSVAQLHGSPGALWDTLKPAMAGHVDALTIVTPFFDPGGKMAVRMAGEAKASSFQVITDMRSTNLTTDGLAEIEAAGGTVSLLDEDEEARLHAKIFVVTGARNTAVVGSANCSHAAWLGHNCELVSFRRDDAAADVVDLVDGLSTRELTDEDRETLDARASEPEPTEVGGELPTLISARWRAGGEIELTLRLRGTFPSHVRVLGAQELQIALLAPGEYSKGLCDISFRSPTALRGASVVVVQLVASGERSNAVVVLDLPEIREHATGYVPAEELLRRLLGEGTVFDGAEQLFDLLAKIAAAEKPSKEKGGSGGENSRKSPKKTKHIVSEQDYATSGDGTDLGLPKAGGRAAPIGARLIGTLLFGEQGDFGDVDGAEGESEAGEEHVTESGYLSASNTRDTGTRPDATLLDAAERARHAYVAAFQRTTQGRDAWRLNRDMQVLLASLHYLLKNGMTPLEFASNVVPLLRAFLGSPHAPLPKAISALEGEERIEAWSRYPFLLNSLLFVYNATLALAEAKMLDREHITDDFVSAKPVLWLRNVVEHTPRLVIKGLLEAVDTRVPSLQRGAFWVADYLPRAGDIVSFPVFVRTVIQDASDLNVASEHLAESVRSECKSASISGADVVVGLGANGHLISGFAEEGNNYRWQGLMYQEAFVAADAGSIEARMRRQVDTQLVPIELLEPLAQAAGPQVERGLAVLRRIASM